MRKFRAEVLRIEYSKAEVVISAKDEFEAENLILDNIDDNEFIQSHDALYEIDYMEEIDE